MPTRLPHSGVELVLLETRSTVYSFEDLFIWQVVGGQRKEGWSTSTANSDGNVKYGLDSHTLPFLEKALC